MKPAAVAGPLPHRRLANRQDSTQVKICLYGVDALTTAERLRRDENTAAVHGFYLAIAHHRLGHPATRPATAGQVKAIYAIARAQHADLEGLLRDEYGVGRPEDQSLSDASAIIDQLKATGAV